MFNVVKKEIDWGGRKFTLESGKIARQADGAVVATYGETSVLATVVGARDVNPDMGFFPLTVHYQEKTFAAGKIPGGFFKREGRPSEKEVLVSRLIDRPIRPLFAEGFKNEVQVICTLLGHDMENDADVVALIAASAALTFSGIPFMGPIGAAKVGYIDGKYVLNPTLSDLEKSELELMVAGTSEGVMMVESEAKELSEDKMLDAVMFGHKEYQTMIKAIIEMAEECAKDPWGLPEASTTKSDLAKRTKKLLETDLRKAYTTVEKQVRSKKITDLKQKTLEKLQEEEVDVTAFDEVAKELEKEIVRTKAIKDGARIDGRDTKTVRPIDVEVGILKRAHGSALFTRGETQALVATTLGTGQDEQIIDAIAGEYRENFMLHYNFPPFSVGETGRFGSPGRREIGHGKLAWRSIHPLLPGKDECPYTIRVVSEITESNGSSSMATVCGTSLSLMDAGISLPRAVAGIAMGLIKEGDDFVVLTDIMGDEDHLGDMDFKVAGTDTGITALQMDIKIPSITEEIMKIALEQANEGRIHILSAMNKVIDKARTELNENVPQMLTMVINKAKIREVIGSGGRVIREICDSTGAKVDIEQDGTVKIAGPDAKSVQTAMTWIQSIVSDPEPGKIYEGVVVKIVDFGAFVRFFGVREGLVHISEISPDTRPEKVTDFLEEGQRVKVKYLGQDQRGKIKLSIKAALVSNQTPPEEATEEASGQVTSAK